MAENPISPHLQVYRPQLTSVTSITHRITGVFLSLGTVALLYWLVAASLGPQAYADMQGVVGSIPGKIVMAGWTFAFFYHLLNGVRHLLFDTGWGFDLDTAYKTGYAVIAGTVILGGLTAACMLAQGGGA
ncbi:MAG: succinate dehydrogenase, cytochrome b556 subunit [Gammaproteobacteria bacterium]